MIKGSIRPVKPSDAELILEWRNKDSVRLNMYNPEVISIETHQVWFDSMLKNKTCQYFIYEQNNEPLGVLSFSEIDEKSKKASWAFYSGATNVRGIGSEMEKLALDYAFNELNLNKLCCEVLEFNSAVIRFHRKFGFKIEGIRKQNYFRDDRFYDVYQLALFKNDYLKTQSNKYPPIKKSFNWNFILTENTIDEFSKLSGDKNLVHLDKEQAIKQGFEDRIAHGALIVAEISKIAAMEFPSKNPIYLSQRIEYRAPVYPNKEIEGKAKLTTQIGRFVIVEYNIYQNNTLVASCESEFLLSNEVS